MNSTHHIDLSSFDLIIVNSSGGKDSICALAEVKEAVLSGEKVTQVDDWNM